MTDTAAGLKIDRVAADVLVEHPENARRGDVPGIVESIEAHGVYKALVVQRSTNRVLAGNHSLKAIRQLGRTEVDVVYLDVDDDEARRILLVDNAASDMASYDDEALVDLLRTLDGDFTGTGFDADAMNELIEGLDATERPSGDTEPMDPPADPRTKLGDVYVLGEHRLLCGDSTVVADVERLMDGNRAQMLFTDPPYGVMHGGPKKNAISGDLSQALIPISFAVALDVALDENARLYVCGGSGNYTMYAKLFDHHLQQQPHLIVWVKGRRS